MDQYKGVQGSIEAVKNLLVTAPVLAHCDLSLPTKMAGDTSAYVIRQFPSGPWRDRANSTLHIYALWINFGFLAGFHSISKEYADSRSAHLYSCAATKNGVLCDQWLGHMYKYW